MKVDVNALFALASLAICIATFFLGRSSAAKQQGTNEGVIATEIKYLREDVTEIKGMMLTNVATINGRVDEVSKQLGEALATAKAAETRADEAFKRLMEHIEDHKCNRL